MRDDPNYRVDGVPPAIRAKVTRLIVAAREAAFSGMAAPEDRPGIEEDLAIARYNLEQTIMTHLKKTAAKAA